MVAVRPTARLKRKLVTLHRRLSLAMASLWLLQAVTGMLIVFHWEIDDASIPARHAGTDLQALSRRIAALAPPGSQRRVTSIWTSAGFRDRYDITVTDDSSGGETTVRVTGDGMPIRTDRPGARRRLIDTIVILHQSLIAGRTGRWIIGASGLMLLTNIAGALVLAWPRRGTWRKVLRPRLSGAAIARHYGWHRAIGLIGALPALVLVGSGVLLAYDDGVSSLIGATPVAMSPLPGRATLPFADAVETAERTWPGSRLAAVTMPPPGDATYYIRLRMPGEWRRAYGASFVLVDATNGHLRGVFPATGAPTSRRFADSWFPVHTGEAGGLPGRVLILLTGLWLASLALIGARLWWLRR